MEPSDKVERLGDLARFFLMERPDGAPLSQSECDEIVSELSGAAAEITRLRAALAAEQKARAELEERLEEIEWAALDNDLSY